MNERTRVRDAAPRRVAIYLRVSTAQQLQGYGLKSQEVQCRSWCADAMRGVRYVVVDVYVDGGVSGKLASRDELDRMTADAMAGRLDVIVFSKLDRIGRTMKDIHRWVFDMTGKGIRIATADGRLDSDGDSDLFGVQLSLLAYMAEVEHALILERAMAGRMQKMEVGGWPLGEPPFGFMLGEDGNPVRHPGEVQQIEVFADFMINSQEDVTREDAARHLNALGYRTRSGKEWVGGNLVGRVLNGLKGYVDFTFVTEDGGGPETATYRIETPKVLSDDKAEALLAVLSRTKRVRTRSKSQYLLSNRLHSVCGARRTGAMVAVGRVVNTAGRYYRCMAGRQGAEVTERHEACWEVPCDDVEAAVWAEVKGLMRDKEQLCHLAEESLGAVPDRVVAYRSRLAELDGEVEKMREHCNRKIALLRAVGGRDDGDTDLVEELVTQLMQQDAVLAAERERVTEWLLEAEKQETQGHSLQHLIRTVDAKGDGFTFEQKATLINFLEVQVRIMDKGVPRPKGLVDPITEWHRETGLEIPVGLTDEMWEKVRGILSGNRQWQDPRGGFEVMLDKLRTGRAWKSYSGSRIIGGRSLGALYRRVMHWFESGEYERALQALAPYAGVPVPPAYVLPTIEVTSVIGSVRAGEHVPGRRAVGRLPGTGTGTGTGAGPARVRCPGQRPGRSVRRLRGLPGAAPRCARV
ncbi:recombinase family protein [Streptomyces sp. NPDC050418]|uniref:recombinase family protein n=1 Tax=Streptomyces sp. NPDC050418 TaxID=3365612 RepID=UPI0037BA7ADB